MHSNAEHWKILKAIESGANIETKVPGGMTPLLVAAHNGEVEMVRTLLDRGANVNVRNRHEATPLILATSNNHASVVPLLLVHGASINAKNEDGRTALCMAALRGYASAPQRRRNHRAQRASDAADAHHRGSSGCERQTLYQFRVPQGVQRVIGESFSSRYGDAVGRS